MRNFKLLLLIIAIVLTASMVFTACSTSAPADQTTAATKAAVTTAVVTTASATDAGLSGSATAVGSSALQPLADKAAKMFVVKNKDAQVTVQGGGSGTGLTQVAAGSCDIGDSDIYANEKLPKDQADTLVDHKICVVGFATVANPKVKVDNLTKQQLVDIFTGKITNWKDVGGDDMKIVIINRPSSSGTRATFKKYALDGKEEAAGLALTEDNSGTVKKAVVDTEGAISYLALSYLDKTIKALKFEGVDATTANITAGTYPIWSYEHMFTKGEAKGVAKAFIDYMMSDEFKPTISELGYIPNSDMKVKRDN